MYFAILHNALILLLSAPRFVGLVQEDPGMRLPCPFRNCCLFFNGLDELEEHLRESKCNISQLSLSPELCIPLVIGDDTDNVN